jgi:hypothetical protein
LFTNISVSPKIDNLKNDFAVWGTRKSATGTDLPIHVRYSVHKKPDHYILPYDRYNKIPDLYYIRATEVDLTPEEGSTETKKDKYEIYSGKLFTLSDDIYTQSSEFVEGAEYYQIETSVKFVSTTITKTNADGSNITSSIEFTGPYQYSYNDQGLLQYKSYTIPDIGVYLKTEQGYINTTERDKDTNELILQPPYELPYYTQEPAGTVYKTKFSKYSSTTAKLVDWRELIYQMAKDYYANNQKEDYLIRLTDANGFVTNGKTGYEQYYSDIQAFWR